MEGLKLIPYLALVLTIAGVILGASVITLSKFGDSPSITKCWNSTYVYNSTLQACQALNSSGSLLNSVTAGYGGNFSVEYYSIDQAMEGEATVAEQQPTIAIIAVMTVIISIIGGVFVYLKYFA